MSVVVNVLIMIMNMGVVASPRRVVDPSLNARVTQAVQEVLDGQADFWNTSFSASFVGSLKNPQGNEHRCTLSVACHCMSIAACLSTVMAGHPHSRHITHDARRIVHAGYLVSTLKAIERNSVCLFVRLPQL